MGLTVLDAGIIIAVLDADDAHHHAARAALHDALDRGERLALPASAYAEAMVGPQRSHPDAVATVDAFIDALPATVEPATRDIARAAAALRGAMPDRSACRTPSCWRPRVSSGPTASSRPTSAGRTPGWTSASSGRATPGGDSAEHGGGMYSQSGPEWAVGAVSQAPPFTHGCRPQGAGDSGEPATASACPCLRAGLSAGLSVSAAGYAPVPVPQITSSPSSALSRNQRPKMTPTPMVI